LFSLTKSSTSLSLTRLREEVASLKRACKRLEELLARARSEVSEVLERLHEVKERISNVEALLLVHWVEAGGSALI